MHRTTSTSQLGTRSRHGSGSRFSRPRRAMPPISCGQERALVGDTLSAGINAMDISSDSGGSSNNGLIAEKLTEASEICGCLTAPASFLKENRVAKTQASSQRVLPQSPAANYLELCLLCRRRLNQGLDIFMYRGDQAFCSTECRCHQIEADEKKEKYRIASVKKGTGAPPADPTADCERMAASETAAAT